jgi:hypothetical protein
VAPVALLRLSVCVCQSASPGSNVYTHMASSIYAKPVPPPKGQRRGGGPRTARARGAPPTPARMIAAIHRRADEDGNGFLSYREFGSIQKALGHEAPNRQRWKQICAVLSCDAQTGVSTDALTRLYDMSGAAPDADYATLFGPPADAVDNAGGAADYDPVAAAKAEHEANQHRPKQPARKSAKRKPRNKGRTVRGIKSTYGGKAVVEITTSADLYGTAGNMAFEVHKRSVEQGNMLRVLQDAVVASEQSGQAEKAKMIEQACAYVKQEAEAVKKAAFTAAYEKLHAKAVEKQKVEATKLAQAEKAKQEKLKREEDRVLARERQKILLQEEKEAKKAEKQLAARASKKNALLLEEQKKAKEDEARSARMVARSQRDRGRNRLLQQHDNDRQEMLEARRQQRALEKAQVEKEREKEQQRLKAAQERNQIELLERALEKAKLEALRRAEIEAMREAKQAIAKMTRDGRFDPTAPEVEEDIAEAEELQELTHSEQQHAQKRTTTIHFPEPEPESHADTVPELAPINRVAVSLSDFPALEPMDGDAADTTVGPDTVLEEPGLLLGPEPEPEQEAEPEPEQEAEPAPEPEAVPEIVPEDTTVPDETEIVAEEDETVDEEPVSEAQEPELQEPEPEPGPEQVPLALPLPLPLALSRKESSNSSGSPRGGRVVDLATPRAGAALTPALTPRSRQVASENNSAERGRIKTPWQRTKQTRRNVNVPAPWKLEEQKAVAGGGGGGGRVPAAAGAAQSTGGFKMSARRGEDRKTPFERRMHHAEQVAAIAEVRLKEQGSLQGRVHV